MFAYRFCDDDNYDIGVGKYATLELAIDAANRYEKAYCEDLFRYIQGDKMKLPIRKGHNYAGF